MSTYSTPPSTKKGTNGDGQIFENAELRRLKRIDGREPARDQLADVRIEPDTSACWRSECRHQAVSPEGHR